MSNAHNDPSSTRVSEKLGFSGSVARAFQSNVITPLLAIVALLPGLFAVLVTPREEEPQINVTMANVLIPFPGRRARMCKRWWPDRPSRCSRRARTRDKTTNWAAYNAALKARGSLTIWLDKDMP